MFLMPLRYKVVASAAVIALLLVAMGLVFHSGAEQRSIRVGFTTSQGQLIGDQITFAWVTNTGHSTITLDVPHVVYENAAGRIENAYGAYYTQKTITPKSYSAALPPGGTACLVCGFNEDRIRLKCVFEYHRKAGPVPRAISKPGGALPLRRLPRGAYDWLRRNGMVDGVLYNRYESPWLANEHLQPTPP